MITAIATLKSVSPLSFGKHYSVEKKEKESAENYELRTWRERCHYDAKTKVVFIPPMALKKAVENAAQYLSEKITGKNNQTYTKHFKSGILVTDGIPLGTTVDKIPFEWLFVSSNGKAGGGKRVWKCFPLVQDWQGKVTYYIMNPIITRDVFERTLTESGKFIGLLRFRPQNGGLYGRYSVEDLKWIEK